VVVASYADRVAKRKVSAIITLNELDRVVRVHSPVNSGTGFTVEDEQHRQFLVTAEHLLPQRDPVELVIEGRSLTTTRVLNRLPVHPEADIAVLLVDPPVTGRPPCPPTSDGLLLGQQCYFLGFPHGLGMKLAPAERIALVKRGIVSSIMQDADDGLTLFLLDGFNNPGFSGGPVIAQRVSAPFAGLAVRRADANRHSRDDSPSHANRIVGVVTGFWPEEIAQPEGWSVVANSGIVTATDVTHVLDAIEGKPLTGPPKEWVLGVSFGDLMTRYKPPDPKSPAPDDRRVTLEGPEA
jgi:hypothetical protein